MLLPRATGAFLILDGADELQKEDAGPLVEAFLGEIAAEESEHFGDDAEIGQIKQDDRRRECDRQAPVPALVQCLFPLTATHSRNDIAATSSFR